MAQVRAGALRVHGASDLRSACDLEHHFGLVDLAQRVLALFSVERCCGLDIGVASSLGFRPSEATWS